ncbi:hypothetical protein [Fuerstiella marisgermanici]|nr:hypothetical protein [Fuerstiella marisgermanici]
MSLQEEHQPLDTAIWNAMLAVLPPDCSAARLEVAAVFEADGGLEMPHSLVALDDSKDLCFPSDEIYQLTREHLAVFERHGKPWASLACTVRFDFDTENWRCSTDYEY